MPDNNNTIRYSPASRPVSALTVSGTGTSSRNSIWSLSRESHDRPYRDGESDEDGADTSLLNHEVPPIENGMSMSLSDHNEQSDQILPNATGTENCQQAEEEEAEKPPPGAIHSTRLHRSAYMIIFTLLYIGLGVFAWVMTCILVFRPITANHYGVWTLNTNDSNGYGNSAWTTQIALYAQNVNWFRAARVVQAIVSVLTIPLTSALCSSAAVIFVQNHQGSFISMRQVMALADNGWTDPAMYFRLFLTSKGFKLYGTNFLLIAIVLNILGGIISPLQEVFLSTSIIQTPTWPQPVLYLVDIPDQVAAAKSDGNGKDINLVTMLTRNALMSTTTTDQQALLWQGSNISCDPVSSDTGIEDKDNCLTKGTLGNMSSLTDPFLAQLPNGYSTGLISQFIPRINSTARYEIIPESEYPTGCGNRPGAFFIDYSNSSIYYGSEPVFWGLQACMPYNMTEPPWKSTRARQDFSEQLYLNITMNGLSSALPKETPHSPGMVFCKVTVNTTAGYFELPNIKNNLTAGPLLVDDPNNHCGSDCESEGIVHSDIYNRQSPSNLAITTTQNSTFPLEQVLNKGPLLTIALALFGESSFLDSRLKYPDAYLYGGPYTKEYQAYTNSTSNGPPSKYLDTCIDFAPLDRLLLDDIGQMESYLVDYCIRIDPVRDHNSDIMKWLTIFAIGDIERMTNAFSAAAFLANQAWLLNNIDIDHRTLSISYDPGTPSQKPVMSLPAMIAISALLGLDFVALLAMALYTCWSPRWTSLLDSFAMMRLGAANADKIPLLVGRRTAKIKVLDEMPGWIGDETDQEEEVGRLMAGANGKIRWGRRYTCYEGDHEKPNPQEILSRAQAIRRAAQPQQVLDAVGIRT